jgi:hypothetical protein
MVVMMYKYIRVYAHIIRNNIAGKQLLTAPESDGLAIGRAMSKCFQNIIIIKIISIITKTNTRLGDFATIFIKISSKSIPDIC